MIFLKMIFHSPNPWAEKPDVGKPAALWFNFRLRRRPSFFFINLFIPVFLISWLPGREVIE